ncbi:hypothetical protein DBR32_12540 [Taibaiella sp. KBW10]|uniref:RHS repeat-associated core domain-containing protein n=1 Tax=Taibaiella sp. KBW10 TaxID=2153357 RepID=UPI000F5A8901|nr:RHS repeat-associated core domain-containing protein [Taibaiella sp. KBW10]RQO30391.1 hypothetical protein DBR32_12540 [Taibaiella sp. KBW10]
MNVLQSRYIYSLLLGLLWANDITEATAQVIKPNIPKLTETAVPGASTVTIPMPNNTTKGRVNYSRTYVPKIRITDVGQVLSASPDKVVVSTTYTNAQGMAEQKVMRNTFRTSGGAYQHTVIPVDTRSMAERYSFMSYSSGEKSYNQSAYLESISYHNGIQRHPEESGNLATDAVISVGLTKNTATASERSVTDYAPGKSRIGQNRGTKSTGILNLGVDAVTKPEANIRIWTINNGIPVSTAVYPVGSLQGIRITNVDGATKIAFSDLSGRLVYECTFVQKITDIDGNVTARIYAITYYVYDLFGRLRFTISPKAVDAIKANWTMTTDILKELCFEYQYDAKGRQIAVHKPGETGFTELVYDKVGKTVMRRSPLEAAKGIWELVYYDRKNRIIATGLLTDNQSRAYWQGQAATGGSATATTQAHYYIWGAGKGSLPPQTGVTNTEVLSYNYYDSYTNTPLSSETLSNTLIQPYLSTAATAEAYVQGPSSFARLTATAVKVIKAPGAGTGLQDWTYGKVFYDSMGRVIYSISQNATGAKDSAATQYNVAGQVLFNILSHNASLSSGNKRSLQLTSHTYEDYSGRLQQSNRKINDKDWEPMVAYTYDEMGRVKEKVFGNNAESQQYTYNVRGELTGINEQYALTGNNGGKGVTFGEALRYDYGFETSRYDGQIAGMLWRGSGGGNVKANAYGYWYDSTGKMTLANYNEAATSGNSVPTAWNVDNKNFAESMAYDINGNIINLRRSGIAMVSGSLSPVALDRLVYTYLPNSNKIDKVIDQNPSNYGVGDFQQGTAQGYSYDASGNLTEDKSKSITGITYTFFNKPQQVSFSNGNTIRYSYDAGGNKVQEISIEGAATTKLNYIANGVYKNEVLQYLSTAEGRTDMSKAQPQEQYFVKDHLGNIRSIIASALTEVIGPGGTGRTQNYSAGYEAANAAVEEQVFENVSNVREEKPGSLSSNDTKAALLDASTQAKTVGTSIVLKVMAGDKISINTNTFYNSLQPNTPTESTGESLFDNIVSSMAGAASALPGGETGIGNDMANQMFNSTEAKDAYTALQQASEDPNKPKAFLNYLFFDEDMKLVSEYSRLWQADGEGQWRKIGTEEEETIEMPKNGYIAVYQSNQTQSATFFDNMSVTLEPGVLIEEKHYYPYGLPMAGMGSAAAGSLLNRQRYQGNEYREEQGLRWMDFNNRQYDPQLGRFLSVDPMADAGGQQVLSPYHAMGCNPVTTVDPMGLQGFHMSMAIGMQAMDPYTAAYYIGGDHGLIEVLKQQDELMAIVELFYQYVGSGLNGTAARTAFASLRNVGLSITPSGGTNNGSTSTQGDDGCPECENLLPEVLVKDTRIEKKSSVAANVASGFYDGFKGTVKGIVSPFTSLEGYVGYMYNTLGGGISQSLVDGATEIITNWDNYSAADVQYGAGYALEKVAEIVLVKKASFSKFGAAAEGESTTLFRAVSKSELDDIAINGIRSSPGYETGKLFATSAEDATNFGRLNFGLDKQPFTIIKTSIPNKYSSMLYRGEMDLMQGVSVPNNLFNQLSKPSIFNQTPLPNHPWIK